MADMLPLAGQCYWLSLTDQNRKIWETNTSEMLELQIVNLNLICM